MTSVITADIEQSRDLDSSIWLPKLKHCLNLFGQTPKDWDIYRGDSFQLEIKDPTNALFTAMVLKAAIKQLKPLDVRMAIGIGNKAHQGESITESNGTAFVASGEQFEKLKEDKSKLSIKTPWPDFDKKMNTMLKVASIAMDNWTVGSAQTAYTLLLNPTLQQQEIGKIMNIKQSAVSGRIKRSHFDALYDFQLLFQQELTSQITNS